MNSESDSARVPFDHEHYVPCLRWKQGEYQALLRLATPTKRRMTPLIEVPEIGWDFERKMQAKTLDQHLPPFAKRVQAKWEDRACFVDLKQLDLSARMADGTHPVDFLFDELRRYGCTGIPVTGVERDAQYQQAVLRAESQDRSGVCLRMGLAQAAKRDAGETINDLLHTLGVKPDKTDFVLDLGAPSFVPLDGFSKVVRSMILHLPCLDQWHTLTVIGTSFPQTMAGLTRGARLVERHEWMLYERVAADLLRTHVRVPTFGDYGIAHPEVFFVDMRIVKPAASIRYTVDDAWYIIKGPNVRDYGYAQYRGLCGNLVSSPYFAGRDFSLGDAYIDDCAAGLKGTGSLTTWRWVATNHHIEKVVVDVANLFGSSSTT